MDNAKISLLCKSDTMHPDVVKGFGMYYGNNNAVWMVNSSSSSSSDAVVEMAVSGSVGPGGSRTTDPVRSTASNVSCNIYIYI